MNKLYVLCGKSAAGKSTVEKILTNSRNFGRIISCTSRPKREGETDGIDYHFFTREQFQRMIDNNEMIEWAEFNGWFYGMRKGSFDLEERNYFAVLNPTGVRSVLDYLGRENVHITYVYVGDRERMLRSLTREQNPDVKEICRRFLTDEKDFDGIESLSDLKVHNLDINETVSIIERNIQK